MLDGLIYGAAGMRCQADRQDLIANNLANINTIGYRRKSASFANVLDQASNAGNEVSVPVMVVSQDNQPGSIIATGNSDDLAIDGNGAFVIQTMNGNVLTRRGNFHLNSAKVLVNEQGMPVLGVKGQIKISGSQWFVSSDGAVHSDGTIVDRLRIEMQPGKPAGNQVSVISGSLETSNVDGMKEMVSMITGLRSYEACQKSIQAIDQTLDKVINQIRI